MNKQNPYHCESLRQAMARARRQQRVIWASFPVLSGLWKVYPGGRTVYYPKELCAPIIKGSHRAKPVTLYLPALSRALPAGDE